MVAKYKDRPLEFWDAKTFTFMRELVSNPPTFSCVVRPLSADSECCRVIHTNPMIMLACSLLSLFSPF